MRLEKLLALLGGLIVGAGLAPSTLAEPPFITVASTTSTQNSGLYDYLLPRFRAATNIDVRVVALGTGAALRLARNGDADVLLVHHRASEEKFVADGFGVVRHPLMFNDFILVGPANDPARTRGGRRVEDALLAIARAQSAFVSRGDDSGTHKRELELWHPTGIKLSQVSGTWYRETGAGMGATLNTAAAMGAYTLTDRATWLSFRNQRNLELLVEDDPKLRNEYGVILVAKTRHPHIKAELGQRFIDWLLSPVGRTAIASFEVAGTQLFHPFGPRPHRESQHAR